jgi:hypothetical protein
MTTYTNSTSWHQALDGQTPFVEEFSGQPTHVIVDGETIALANGFSLVGDGTGGLGFLGYRTIPAMPTPNLETDFEFTGTGLFFNFTMPVRGFGFNYAGADFATSILISGVSTTEIFPPSSPSLDSAAFFGILLDTLKPPRK